MMNSPRHNIPHHMTASGLVITNGHILLVHHKRINAWVPPGGHVEETELPQETVIREILEETNIEVEILADAMPETGNPDAFFLKSPFYLQCVKAIEGGQEYYHLDLAYLCRPVTAAEGLPQLTNSEELNAARWIPLDEIDKFQLAKNVKEALGLALQRLKILDILDKSFSQGMPT